MEKQNNITLKTRKKLINAFWNLYKVKNLNKITISEICDVADYDRTTFYRYFLDISDMLNQIEDEIINNIKNGIINNSIKLPAFSFDGFKRFNEKYGEYIVTFFEKGNV